MHKGLTHLRCAAYGYVAKCHVSVCGTSRTSSLFCSCGNGACRVFVNDFIIFLGNSVNDSSNVLRIVS